MNLKILTKLIAEYGSSIALKEDDDWLQPWKSLSVFQYHWDLNASDFARMYDDSFGGNNYLWEGDDFHPKSAMLHYSIQNPDLVRSMFLDLYDEGRDVVGRIHRFIDQCDQLRTYYSKGITKREAHYHSDRKMIFCYLAFRYPEKYTLYEEEGFRKLLNIVNAKPLGSLLDIERYMKTSRTLDSIMRRNEGIMDQLLHKVKSEVSCSEKSLINIYDFYKFIRVS